MFRIIAAIGVICALLSLVLFAGCGSKTVDFEVTVTDTSGNPLAGAKVISEEQPGDELKLTGLSKDDGKVKFEDILVGEYSFYVNRFDYVQQNFDITIDKSHTSITIRLEKDQ